MRKVPVVIVAGAMAVIVPLAASRYTPSARGQVVTGPPTTPQPTVLCTPPTRVGDQGCGRGTGTQRDVAFAWIDRYCNGDAVPTPPGETTFALNYGLGGQSSGAVQFQGILTANGVEIPSAPLLILQPGQKDTRIRTGVVANDVVFEVTLTGTYVSGPDVGNPVLFGNGTNIRIRSASGNCPTAQTVPIPSTTGPIPTITGPTVSTTSPGISRPTPSLPTPTFPKLIPRTL